MELSVVICTFNRQRILKDTLESFAAMDLPGDMPTELLIVDNNSTDATPSVARTFLAQHPTLVRLIEERRPGLSHARNAGLGAARGAIIAFSDDDVYFDPHWAVRLVDVFRQDPSASCVGGKCIPVFEGGRPDWISDTMMTPYGSTNSGEDIKVLQYPDHPFGLNMAFRRSVFDVVGTFNTALGRQKHSLRSNEDSDLFQRAAEAGLKTVYTPHAIVRHRIPKERANRTWMLRRYYWQGISDALQLQAANTSKEGRSLREAYGEMRALATCLIELARLRVRGRARDSNIVFLKRRECYYLAGKSYQTLRAAVLRG